VRAIPRLKIAAIRFNFQNELTIQRNPRTTNIGLVTAGRKSTSKRGPSSHLGANSLKVQALLCVRGAWARCCKQTRSGKVLTVLTTTAFAVGPLFATPNGLSV
jgi:hypothetical protein